MLSRKQIGISDNDLLICVVVRGFEDFALHGARLFRATSRTWWDWKHGGSVGMFERETMVDTSSFKKSTPPTIWNPYSLFFGGSIGWTITFFQWSPSTFYLACVLTFYLTYSMPLLLVFELTCVCLHFNDLYSGILSHIDTEIFWHILWHYIWQSFWQEILCRTSYLAFYLSSDLTYIVAFYLSFYLTCCLGCFFFWHSVSQIISCIVVRRAQSACELAGHDMLARKPWWLVRLVRRNGDG